MRSMMRGPVGTGIVRRQQLAPPQGNQDNGDAVGGRLQVQDFGAAGTIGLFLGVVILRIWEAMPRARTPPVACPVTVVWWTMTNRRTASRPTRC